MIDLMIYETGDGGDLESKSGYISTIDGLTNQLYLALFGGNLDDSWWGNYLQPEENKFISTFENALRNIALNSNGISILENAAKSDLAFLNKYANINVSVTLPALNRVQLLMELQEPDKVSQKIKFLWDGTKNELIEDIEI
jgi:phage gp46-like protein